MARARIIWSTVLVGAVMLAFGLPVWPQTASNSRQIAQPDYMSGPSQGPISSRNFNTPEADGRPGWKFFNEGMQSYHEGDFNHAFYMLKLAAYWDYEPAAYNLGVMYFQGENVAKDRALGTAWMFIAAERGTQRYVDARHMMVENLDGAERTQALADYNALQPKYGGKVTARRAGAHWAFVKSQATGSRVGGAGSAELRVGLPASSNSGAFHSPASGPHGITPTGGKSSAMQVLAAGSTVDGSTVYRQFQQSANPYSQTFLQHRTGKATVGPLHEITPASKTTRSASEVSPASSSSA